MSHLSYNGRWHRHVYGLAMYERHGAAWAAYEAQAEAEEIRRLQQMTPAHTAASPQALEDMDPYARRWLLLALRAGRRACVAPSPEPAEGPRGRGGAGEGSANERASND